MTENIFSVQILNDVVIENAYPMFSELMLFILIVFS